MAQAKPERSAREDAPQRHVFRDLLRTAHEDVKEKHRQECTFVIATAGLLGLRGGEIAHMTRDWVDLNNCSIRIPRFDECQKSDGEPCGYCRKRARSKASLDEDLTFDEALNTRWEPKMEASARTVPFGWSNTLIEIYDDFWQEHDSYPHSRVSINRRVDRVARKCDSVRDSGDVYPHSLRAHAGIFHVQQGLGPYHLMRFMGWDNVRGAMPYVKMVNSDVRDSLQRIHSGRDEFSGILGGNSVL